MMKLRTIPVMRVKFSNLETKDEEIDEGIDNAQFSEAHFSGNGIYNSMRNVSVRGYHKDNLTDRANVGKIKHIIKEPKSNLADRFDDNRVLDLEVRNLYDRGYNLRGGALDAYQEAKKRTLRWNPMTDFDDAGLPGTTSGISTEQGDPLVEIKRDSIQGIKKPTEPYVSMRKYGSMKLRNLKNK